MYICIYTAAFYFLKLHFQAFICAEKNPHRVLISFNAVTEWPANLLSNGHAELSHLA